MDVNDIIKNSVAYKKLVASEAQSYLITGADERGIALLCDAFIEARTGKSKSADVARLPLSEGGKVLVSDVEYVTQNAAVTPTELPQRYFIIERGETMSDAAANKLLKTLEEPPPLCVIIILTQNDRFILPTIKSRCFTVNLAPFDEDELAAAAEETYPDSPSIELAKAVNMGSIARMEKAARGELTQIETLVFDVLLFMRKSSAIVQYAQRLIAMKDVLRDAIEFFDFTLHDAARYAVSPTLVRNKPRLSDYASISEFYGTDCIIRLRPTFARTYERLAGSGNLNSVVDEFLFSLLEVRQKCRKS